MEGSILGLQVEHQALVLIAPLLALEAADPWFSGVICFGIGHACFPRLLDLFTLLGGARSQIPQPGFKAAFIRRGHCAQCLETLPQ